MAFRLPPYVRPTFDPSMMGADEMPTVTGMNGGPPPMPRGAPPASIPPPPPVDAMPQRRSAIQEAIQQERPPVPKMSGWRGYVGALIGGGAPALAQHALNPNYRQQQAEYAANQEHLKQRMAAEHMANQDELAGIQKRAYSENINSQVQARIDANADRDESREQGYLREGWRDVAPGSVMPPMPKDGAPQRTESAQVGGRLRQRQTPYGAAMEKNEAEQSTWREVPAVIAAKLGMKPGSKVPPNELDGYLRIVQTAEDKETDRKARAELQDERLAVTKALHAVAQSNGGGSFQPLTNDRGEVISFFNPKTKESVAPPMPGARKGPVAAGELDKRATMEVMFQNTDTLAQLGEKHSAVIGRVKGALTDIERKNFGVDESVNDLFRISDNMADQLLRARSGAAITEPEYVRMRSLMPDPRAPLPKFKSDLRLFRTELQQIYKAKTGRDIGGQQPDAPAVQKPIVQHSKSTGKYRHSLDGGKTWQDGQPQQRQ
jgi:hypothetical protein